MQELPTNQRYSSPDRVHGNRLLNRLPETRRGAVNNLFLAIARRLPEATPKRVLKEVLLALEAKGDRQDQCELIRQHVAEALDLATYALAWDQLPVDVRAARREAAAQAGRDAHMATKPPSEKQLDLLRKLQPPTTAVLPATMLEASKLIELFKKSG